YTGFVMPCFFANSSEHRIAAAAPHVGGQHWYLVSGSNTSSEPMISSIVITWLNSAYELFDACFRAFTLIIPKVSRFVPYFHRYSRPAPPNICAAGGAWLKPCTLLMRPACHSRGFARSLYFEPSAPFSIFSKPRARTHSAP